MPTDIRDAIYSGIANQFPAIYREDGDFLVSFVEAYYKHLDEKMDRNLPKLRDIDTTLSTFLLYYKKKFLADLPIDTSLDTRYIIKHIQDMYSRKGTQESLELMFRMFFDEDIEVFYPSTSILRPSDSIWGGDAYLEMSPIYQVDDYAVQKGQRIKGDVSLATAFVDEVIFVNFTGALIPLVYLSNISGTFNSDDGILVITTDKETGLDVITNVGRLIHGSIDNITVDTNKNRLPDQSIGDSVRLVSSLSGVEGRGRVLEVSDTPTGVIDFSIVDGGFGYVDPSSATLTAKNDIGVSNQVMVLNGMTKLDIQRGDVIIANGKQLTYFGSDEDGATPYAITGSAKVIEYTHPLLFLYSDDYETVRDYLNRQAVPTSGSDVGVLTNVFLQSMKNAAERQHYDGQVLPGFFEAPRYLSDTYLKEYKALSLPNQMLGQWPKTASTSNNESLGHWVGGDSAGYGSANVSPSGDPTVLGVNSRQIAQEYINVLNVSGNFPTFSPSLFESVRSDDLDAIAESWNFFLRSAFLALSKVDIYPQMTVSRPKQNPALESTFLEDGEDYLVWDNGSDSTATAGIWNSITGGATQTLVEGDIITIDYSAHQQGSDQGYLIADSFSRFVRFVPRAGRTDEELQALHLNRLKFRISVFDNIGYPSRISDNSGEATSYPQEVNAPSFTLERFRGDLHIYEAAVETDVKLPIAFQSFGTINRSAEFEIGALTNVETVSLIPDLIEDYQKIKLDIPAGEPGGANDIDNDDYGMSGPNNENLNTEIGNAFSPITLKIGTISDLTILNPGLDYQNDVAIAIEHLAITKFNKRDVILNFDAVNIDIDVGEVITQNIQIPDLQINQSGNYIHNATSDGVTPIIETMGCTATGSNYQNSNTVFDLTTGETKAYTVKAKFLKREGNDFFFRPLSFYGFEGNTSLVRMLPNQEYKIVDLGNTPSETWRAIGASDAPQEGEVFVSKSKSVIDQQIGAGDTGIVCIPAIIGSTKKALTRIFDDPTSPQMGANAEIQGNASYQTGQISRLGVTKTGYTYTNRELVDVINNEPTSPNYNKIVANANIRVQGQGKTEGKWSSKTSFLSESTKSLHDNDYFQEYSYEVSSIVSPSRYEPLIKETVGVAGTKLFSKPLVNSVNDLDGDLNLEISTFNIQGTQLASTRQIFLSSIEQGTKYRITDLGTTPFASWSSLGGSVNEDNTTVGGNNLEIGQPYRILDMGDATWEKVQYLDSSTRTDWFSFWTYFGFDLFVDFDGDGRVRGSEMLDAAKMVSGLQDMDPRLEQKLLAVSEGQLTDSAYTGPSVGTRTPLDAPSIVNSVVFSKQSLNVGQEFIATRNGIPADAVGNGKVSYSDSIFVTPYYKNDLSDRGDHTWGSFTPPQTYLDGANPIQLEHNDLLDDPDDQAGITNYTHDNARTIRYSDMETGVGYPARFWRIKSFPITGNSSTDGHNEHLSPSNTQANRHIKSWNPEDMSAESNLQKDYLQGLWQTYFITGLETATSGDRKIGTRDDPTTYPNIDTTLLQSYLTGSGIIESDDVTVPITHFPDTIISPSGWSIGRLELVDVTDNTIMFTPDTMVGADGYTITTSSNHYMTNDTLLEYRKHTSTGSSGNLEEEYVVTEFSPGTFTISERDIQPHYYYAVNVTENTFQLSKTPMLLDLYTDDPQHDPIDLSTMTSGGGLHLLSKVTGIYADDSILIGIQEQ